jgi:hypothetical protein
MSIHNPVTLKGIVKFQEDVSFRWLLQLKRTRKSRPPGLK